ncbi:tyrosine-protein kinase [Anopheles sinensis]|uniref:Tyrosine-protein kinase n=1 Tax=Anopheles sinensis TaxID=74873 RepID=A0A084VPX0_ANOSI|nr:tyrosine-protein kinase [Anopheles sinensis]
MVKRDEPCRNLEIPTKPKLVTTRANQSLKSRNVVYPRHHLVCMPFQDRMASLPRQVYSLSTMARSIHSNGSNTKDKLRKIAVTPGTIIQKRETYGASLSQVAYLLS